MARPRDISAIDTLIGFRKARHVPPVPALRGSDAVEHHPHGYMFKDIPSELSDADDHLASISETLAKMDLCGVARGMISVSDSLAPHALAAHPDRFIGALPVDGNEGMTAVRKIVTAVQEYGIRAVTLFPSGLLPQVPINDKHWYPIYAKCVELDLPVFVCVGVPGPRVPMMAQYVGHLDEVCYDFPDLKVVMRHGAEPWEDLAVKLMLKWPNLYYSTSAFSPRYYPKAIIDYANTRGADKIIYAGYFPFGLELERIFSELDGLTLKDEVWPKFLHDNAARVLGLEVESRERGRLMGPGVPTTSDTPVLVTLDQRVALVTLNRPERANGWTPELGRRYFEILTELARDEDVRAIIVTGAGASFCVGGDGAVLSAMASAGGDAPAPKTPHWFPLSIGKPVIAAINGACFGIGLQQALCCDVRFAADDAKFSTAYVRRGLVAEQGMSWLLPRIVGTGHAMDLLLSGRVVRAPEAAAIGLVNRVVPASDLLAEAQSYARVLAESCAPASMWAIKRQCYVDLTSNLFEAYARAEAELARALAEPDFAEGVSSWQEKRAPAFAGLPAARGLIDLVS